MRETSIARNYAEALIALAGQVKAQESWGTLIAAVADAVRVEPALVDFLAAPHVSAAQKKQILFKAFGASLPRPMVLFLGKLVDNRRQMLIPAIAIEYANLVDQQAERVHAQVTVARDVTDADRAAIARQLSERLGKTVVPHVRVNPAILGGVIVKVGDTVMDGSVRRRLAVLRGRLASSAR